jgi:hypothetical protein
VHYPDLIVVTLPFGRHSPQSLGPDCPAILVERSSRHLEHGLAAEDGNYGNLWPDGYGNDDLVGL